MDEEKTLEQKKKTVMDELHHFFKPEFLNRIDEFIFFNPLNQKDLKEIVKIQLKDVQKRLLEKNIQLKFKPTVYDHLIRKGYDTAFGARPLKRAIQTELLNPLALRIISKKIDENSKLEVDANDLGLEFRFLK